MPGFTYLCHDHVLALLDVFAVCFHNGLQKPQILHVAAVCLNAVHKVLHRPLADLIAQVVVVCEDVPHGFGFKELIQKQTDQNAAWKNGEDGAVVKLWLK